MNDASSAHPESGLGFGLSFADLFEPSRLSDLDRRFRDVLRAEDPNLASRFEAWRSGEALPAPKESALLVDAARRLSDFVATLFGVAPELAALRERARDEAVLFRFRWSVFQKRAARKYPDAASLATVDAARAEAAGSALLRLLGGAGDEELRVARAGWELHDLAQSLATPRGRDATRSVDEAATRVGALRAAAAEAGLPSPDGDGDLLAAWNDLFDAYVARLRFAPGHASFTKTWSSFFLPKPTAYDRLVPTARHDLALPEARSGLHHRPRAGFALTDGRKPSRDVTGETHYCLLCHEREKDSCSKGFRQKDGSVKANPLGAPLTGCPLDEKISEMHLLRREGDSLGALALVVVDNPMLPGTGHRICNDCMKGCIFQTQTPVDIPQVETGVLTDVLKMPWGYEIWSLLTRWNPLNRKRPFALPYNGKNVLVVGLGPAGYTLSHHLLNEGFGVVAIDGLKIEPLPAELKGSETAPPTPVREVGPMFEPLDKRRQSGFGGVAEYGITVRWDKNFLDLLHLNLGRRRLMRIYGGTRFGGTVNLDQAFSLGFDHVAIAAGAGKPTLVPMKNNLIRGVRAASDFLMALQLTGAFREDALANLNVELPIVVIGGGLTAIDTATESLAYYPIHVERLLARFEALVAERGGEEAALSGLPEGDRRQLLRQLEHGRAIRAERAHARSEGRTPDFARLVKEWGGATLTYRRALEESPAYRLNHEEVEKALEEGIIFAENLTPLEAVPDAAGSISAVVFRRADGTTVALPARTLLVAAGTSPNVTYEKEYPGTFPLDARGRFFRPHVAERGGGPDGGPIRLVPKDDGVGAFFTGAVRDGKLVSYFGDNHPVYAGSVVKAMASAKHGAPKIRELFADELDAQAAAFAAGTADAAQRARDAAWSSFGAKLDDLLVARVVRVDRLTPTIVEVVVKAPLAARNFHPGQFYRFQNYEAHAPRVHERPGAPPTTMTIEPCALTGAWVDKEKGILSMVTLELGVSSRLCAALKPGEPVVVMGPTGSPTEIPEDETVLLVGGGLGNAVLFSIAREARRRGNRVLYVAGYKKASDFYKREEIEASADCVVWATDVAPIVPAVRPQDKAFHGNVVEAMLAYAEGKLGPVAVDMRDATRLIVIGSDRMMAAVAAARKTVLKPYLSAAHVGIGSINSPMQCMMKEVCAQCLQRHVDPVTKKESFVFSCFNQDQNLDWMDWEHLRSRLAQNAVEERLSNEWLSHLLAVEDVRVV